MRLSTQNDTRDPIRPGRVILSFLSLPVDSYLMITSSWRWRSSPRFPFPTKFRVTQRPSRTSESGRSKLQDLGAGFVDLVQIDRACRPTSLDWGTQQPHRTHARVQLKAALRRGKNRPQALVPIAQKTGRTVESVCFLPRPGLWTRSLFTSPWTNSMPCPAR